jgi:lipopolysaccharide export LptBFGC system permease protein LptF
LDKEERELQIRLAQLNAELQINIAWTFGVFASAITLFIFGLQFDRINFGLSVIAWTASFVFVFLALGYAYRAWTCLGKFEKLQ